MAVSSFQPSSLGTSGIQSISGSLVIASDFNPETTEAIYLRSEIYTPTQPSDGQGGVMYTKADGKMYWSSWELGEVDLTDSGITVSDNTDNRVLTGDGSNAVAEPNLIFDGSRLGINTSNPSVALHVVGSQAYLPSEIAFESDTNTMVRSRGVGQMEFRVSNTDHLVLIANSGSYFENGNVAIGYNTEETIPDKLSVRGNVNVSGSVIIGHTVLKTVTTNMSGTDWVALDSFNFYDFRTVKYLVEIKDETNDEFVSEEILLVHDGTNVFLNEYGILYTGEANFSTFKAEMNNFTNMVTLSCKCTNANNVAKLTRTIMTAY